MGTIRISIKDIEELVKTLNELTPDTPEYVLQQAYGAVGLHQKLGNSSAQNTIFGFTTKRELSTQIQSYLKGIRLCHQQKT